MGDETVILEAATSPDGTKRWTFVRRADGFFSYSEESYVDLGDDGGVDGYWTGSHASGLFETAEAAREDARGSLGWLDGGSGGK